VQFLIEQPDARRSCACERITQSGPVRVHDDHGGRKEKITPAVPIAAPAKATAPSVSLMPFETFCMVTPPRWCHAFADQDRTQRGRARRQVKTPPVNVRSTGARQLSLLGGGPSSSVIWSSA
jgi:hypothetical protein